MFSQVVSLKELMDKRKQYVMEGKYTKECINVAYQMKKKELLESTAPTFTESSDTAETEDIHLEFINGTDIDVSSLISSLQVPFIIKKEYRVKADGEEDTLEFFFEERGIKKITNF